MKKGLTDILACPACKSKLELKISEESKSEVTSGSLRCPKCGVYYPIENDIPNLLPPPPAD